MVKAIICDIDGTLADCRHRLHHVTRHPKDWDAFYAKVSEDGLHQPVADLLAMAGARGSTILLVSGRREECRADTVAWLDGWNVRGYSALLMRASGDMRADHIVKSEILDNILGMGYEIEFVVDDRPSVVKMWRERGLFVFQCDPGGDVNHDAAPGLLTLMIGPTCAGKTTWLANATAFKIHPSHIVSSDQIRADLCGDWRDQSRNEDVFAALHSIVGARLRAGLPACVDATNLHRRDRMAILAHAPQGTPIRYIVLDRPLDVKLRDAGWREMVPGLIEKHHGRFQSALRDILAGDGLPGVEVLDLRDRGL